MPAWTTTMGVKWSLAVQNGAETAKLEPRKLIPPPAATPSLLVPAPSPLSTREAVQAFG